MLPIPALLLGLAPALPAPALQAPETPFLDLTAADAFVRGQDEGKPVLMWVYDLELPECRRMQQIFRDPQLSSWLKEHTIAIQRRPEDEQKLVSRLAAQVTPTTVLMSPDQGLIERVEGGMDAKAFLLTFELALIGMGAPERPEGDRAEDPYAWLGYANHLFSTGNEPEECLAAYLWVLDNGDAKLPGLRARILEFLLKRIAYLKVSSDNAAPRLIARRDGILARVAATTATAQDVHELVRFNFWLRNEHDTQNVFATLDGTDPDQRRIKEQLLLQDLEWVVAYRHYADVHDLVPDPMAHIRQRFEALDAWTADPTSAPPEVSYGYTESRNFLVRDAALHYEVLLAVGLGRTAQELADYVLAKVPTGRAYTLFMSKANRLEVWSIARALGAKGLEVLGAKGQKMVRTSLLRIDGLEKRANGEIVVPEGGGR